MTENCGDGDKSLDLNILFDLIDDEIDADGNKDDRPKEKDESKSCRRWLTGQDLKEGNITEDKEDKEDKEDLEAEDEDKDDDDDDDESTSDDEALTANGFKLLEDDMIELEDGEDNDDELVVVFVISFSLFDFTGDPITTGDLWPVDLPLK